MYLPINHLNTFKEFLIRINIIKYYIEPIKDIFCNLIQRI